MRDTLINYLYELLEKNEKAILLTADLGFGIFDKFEKYRNTKYFNVGVCEQLMSSLATGLSLEGKEVFTYSIGVFPTLRCLEQIRNDISYHDCNVKIISSGAGFSYGSLGMSHHCVQDIGFMSSIPGISIITPANKLELSLALKTSQKLSYFRIDKSELDLKPKSLPKSIYFPIPYFLKENNCKTLILFHGSIGSIALNVIKDIDKKIDIFSVPALPSNNELMKLILKYENVITIEEHSIVNGFFSYISSMVSSINNPPRIIPIALPHEHQSIVGSQTFLREKSGLNSDKLLENIKKI